MQVFVPFTALMPREALADRNRRMFLAIGRLAPGASVAAAQTEMSVIAGRLATTHPDTNQRVSVSVGPERTALFREAPQLAYVVVAVFGTFALLLMMACVNLAALLTARATFRRREIAIRAAQGATRGAIAAQLFMESLMQPTPQQLARDDADQQATEPTQEGEPASRAVVLDPTVVLRDE